MSVYRKWYCTCGGRRAEMNYNRVLEEEGEPYCERCGATPSSDPRRTVLFRDVDDRED